MAELEEIQAEIRKIDQEMAVADRRLERFRQAAAEIRKRNRHNLETMGLASGDALEKMLREQGVHPEGMKMFRQALEKKGLKMPASLEELMKEKTEAPSGETAEPSVKKKKRVRFWL